MQTTTGAGRPPALDMNQARATQTTSQNVSNGVNGSYHSPTSSTPATPNLTTPVTRRPSHPATSPIAAKSPRPLPALRRTSSAQSLNERPTSSPNPMRRRSSRQSLGAQNENDEKRPTPKRSISNLISGLRDAQTRMEAIEEPVPLTASGIAVEHFVRELVAHSKPEAITETAVILHDACYGHRYSRPKTTKSTLSMIVERPERLHASVLGAATAYVRLGGHHAGGRNAPHPDRVEPNTPSFKIRRSGRSLDITSSYVTNVHGISWMSELRTMCTAAAQRLAAGEKELSRASTPTEPERKKLHEGDLYLSPESLNAFEGALGGVADAVDTVFAPSSHTKRAFVAVRPPGHHCSADHPSGFCWLNNVHVGIEYAAQTYGLTHAAILDFDLHHGDGSQAITWQRNSRNNEKRLNAKQNSKLKLGPDIGYYSLHDINSYPCEMGDDDKVQAASICIDNSHGQSIWNVHLQTWKSEADFWQLYETQYRVLLDKARRFLQYHTSRLQADGKAQPKAGIFISAGFDASEWEGAGMQRHKVSVPTEFYARFTRDVVKLAQEDGVACDGRVISVLEGGYSDRALCSGVLSHLSGLCAKPVDTAKARSSGIGGLDQMMRGLGINESTSSTPLEYDKAWWSAANLTALEMKVNPPPPPQLKKGRTGPQPTYATPTESFAYKVVDTDKFARSISGTMREAQRPARPPTPPAPEVDWVVATQELLKLLVPTDRQTKSCTAEELGGVRVKKETGSAAPAMTTEDSTKPRQLRDRRSKLPAYPESADNDELETSRSVSRSSRRQTIQELPSSSQGDLSHQRRASRRLSAGSTFSSVADDADPRPPPMPTIPATPNGPMKPPAAPAAGMQMQKTRIPSKPKAQAAPTAPKSPARASKAASKPPAPSTKPANQDMDALTTGMKKVTLKVGTKEEHDRKQKENVDAERRARGLKAAETRKANAAAKKAAETGIKIGPTPSSNNAKENTGPSVVASAAEPSAPASQLVPRDPVPTEQVMSSPMLPNYSMAAYPMYARAPAAQNPQTYYHKPQSWQEQHRGEPNHTGSYQTYPQTATYQPSSPTSAWAFEPSVPDSAARQLINESNVAYGMAPPVMNHFAPPATSPNGVQLPTWSSTGAIPFATNNGNVQHPPGGMSAVPNSSAGIENEVSFVKANADGPENDTLNNDLKVEKQEASIWDVPETPQRTG